VTGHVRRNLPVWSKVRSRTVQRCRFGDGTFRWWHLQICYV